MKKKILAVLLAVLMLLTVAVPAFAADHAPGEGYNVYTTYGQLEEIVSGIVDGQLSGNGLLNQGQDYVRGIVTNAVMGLLGNGDAILGFASPLLGSALNGLINGSLKDSGLNLDQVDVSGILDSVLTSDLIGKALSIDIIYEILERTIEYTVDDIMAKALPSLNQAEADRDALIKKYADYFFETQASSVKVGSVDIQASWLGASTINPFWKYENFKFKLGLPPWTFDITGWNKDLISLGITGDQVFGSVSDVVSFNINDFMDDLPNMIWAAVQRAAVDVVTEKIEALKVQIKGIIEAEIQKLKNKAEETIMGLLAGIINQIEPGLVKATDTIQDIKAKVENAIDQYNGTKEQIENMIKELEALKTKIQGLPFDQYKDDARKLLEGMIDKFKGQAEEAIKKLIIDKANKLFDCYIEAQDSIDQIKAKICDAIDKYKGAKQNLTELMEWLKNLECKECYRGNHSLCHYNFKFDLCGFIRDLHGKCKEKCEKVTVTFIVDGEEYAAVTFKAGLLFPMDKLPANPEKDGFTFVGWFPNTGDMSFAFTTTKIFDDTTLTARWRSVDPNCHIVTFVYDNGTPNVTETVAHGGYIAKPADPEKDGFTFVGWFLDDEEFDFDTQITGDITLKAVWIENNSDIKYTVTFVSKCETDVPPQVITAGEKATDPGTLLKTDYTFDGWYITDEEGTLLDYEKFDFDTPITGDIILTANWIYDYVTITFNSNGGSEVEDQIIERGAFATRPEDPVKAGYSFSYWQVAAAEFYYWFDFENEVYSDIELIAVWDLDPNFTLTKVVRAANTNNPWVNELTMLSPGGEVTFRVTVSVNEEYTEEELARAEGFVVWFRDIFNGEFMRDITNADNTRDITDYMWLDDEDEGIFGIWLENGESVSFEYNAWVPAHSGLTAAAEVHKNHAELLKIVWPEYEVRPTALNDDEGDDYVKPEIIPIAEAIATITVLPQATAAIPYIVKEVNIPGTNDWVQTLDMTPEGGLMRFRVTIGNTGNAPADVVFQDLFDGNAFAVNSIAAGLPAGAVPGAGQVISMTIAPNQPVVFEYNITIPANGTTAAVTHTNYAGLVGTEQNSTVTLRVLSSTPQEPEPTIEPTPTPTPPPPGPTPTPEITQPQAALEQQAPPVVMNFQTNTPLGLMTAVPDNVEIADIVEQADGSFVAFDQSGAPLGEFTADESGEWTFEEFTPLGDMPTTGEMSVTILLGMLGLMCIAAGLVVSKRRGFAA